MPLDKFVLCIRSIDHIDHYAQRNCFGPPSVIVLKQQHPKKASLVFVFLHMAYAWPYAFSRASLKENVILTHRQ